jgi:hypothetical protein
MTPDGNVPDDPIEQLGVVFDNLEHMVEGLPRLFDLDRRRVRTRAVERFGVERMVNEYVAVYRDIVEAHHGRTPR